MFRTAHRLAAVCGVLAGLIAAGVMAQVAQVYRYQDNDGRIVYSDRPPPPNSKDVEVKRLGPNIIESEVSISTQVAQERYPVTLYTFACGDLCRNAESLLNRRGIPFSTVNVSQAEGAERLQRLTGDLQAPVLQVGDRLIAKGFNETVWQSMLSEAGYPTTPPLRRTQTARAPAEGGKVEVPKAASGTPGAPPPGSGYPVN